MEAERPLLEHVVFLEGDEDTCSVKAHWANQPLAKLHPQFLSLCLPDIGNYKVTNPKLLSFYHFSFVSEEGLLLHCFTHRPNDSVQICIVTARDWPVAFGKILEFFASCYIEKADDHPLLDLTEAFCFPSPPARGGGALIDFGEPDVPTRVGAEPCTLLAPTVPALHDVLLSAIEAVAVQAVPRPGELFSVNMWERGLARHQSSLEFRAPADGLIVRQAISKAAQRVLALVPSRDFRRFRDLLVAGGTLIVVSDDPEELRSVVEFLEHRLFDHDATILHFVVPLASGTCLSALFAAGSIPGIFGVQRRQLPGLVCPLGAYILDCLDPMKATRTTNLLTVDRPATPADARAAVADTDSEGDSDADFAAAHRRGAARPRFSRAFSKIAKNVKKKGVDVGMKLAQRGQRTLPGARQSVDWRRRAPPRFASADFFMCFSDPDEKMRATFPHATRAMLRDEAVAVARMSCQIQRTALARAHSSECLSEPAPHTEPDQGAREHMNELSMHKARRFPRPQRMLGDAEELQHARALSQAIKQAQTADEVLRRTPSAQILNRFQKLHMLLSPPMHQSLMDLRF
eukprot:gnl/Chilomastix_cuspidata/1059.p1 GENE.gnl/Chilomastix_cuspidata/1059~~gnl/Chilomastix_cuspidata/1059.p1  ORF type:complete len:608 (+),score=186.18 gnl/Chilomastix_cuspidata/1059:103-1824(+)